MGQMKITCYFNTGFRMGGDIPATQAVVEGASSRTYPGYYLREDLDNPTVKINDTYDRLADVDYVKIENQSTGRISFFFATPRALAKSTTALELSCDYLLTLGGAGNLTYTGGWIERGHIPKAEDTPFSNTAGEAFAPSQELKIVNYKKLNNPGTDVYEIVTTAVNLEPLETSPVTMETIDSTGTDGTVKMCIPKLTAPSAGDAAKFFMYDLNEGSSKQTQIPGTASYLMLGTAAAKVNDGLAKLFSIGQTSIQDAYVVPRAYVSSYAYNQKTGEITTLYGKYETVDTGIPFSISVPGYTIRNQKTNTLFRTMSIRNIASGGTITKAPSVLYQAGQASPKVNIWADPTGVGKPFARFAYISGAPDTWADTVQGSQWTPASIVMSGASGSFWTQAGYGLQQAQIDADRQAYDMNRDILSQKQKNRGFRQGGSVLGSIGQAVGKISTGNAAGGLGSLFDAGMQLSEMQIQSREENLALEQDRIRLQERADQAVIDNSRSLAKTPTILSMPSPSLSTYGYNYFTSYETRMQDSDIKRLDEYFDRYGYNGIHRPLTGSSLNARRYFTYVECSNVNIKSNFGLRVREGAARQLEGGVRIWKVLPDASYYTQN